MTLPVPAPAALPARSAVVPRGRDPYWVYLDSLRAQDSKRTMRGCLDKIARLFTGDPQATGAGQPWHLLRYEHTMNIASQLRETGMAPAYYNKHLVALRRVLREAWRLGLMSAEECERASDIEGVRYTRLPTGQHVPVEVVGAVLAVCDADPTPAGVRDGALLVTLYSSGCRRAEIAALTLADYRQAERALRVRGKGDKERLVFITPKAVARLEAWLAVRGSAPGALFCPINKSGRLRVEGRSPIPMSGQAIADIVDRRLLQAGASRRTPHDFRRTFIGELLDRGVDLATAQSLVGHASPATTSAYDRRPDRRKREAVDRLDIPDPRPLR